MAKAGSQNRTSRLAGHQSVFIFRYGDSGIGKGGFHSQATQVYGEGPKSHAAIGTVAGQKNGGDAGLLPILVDVTFTNGEMGDLADEDRSYIGSSSAEAPPAPFFNVSALGHMIPPMIGFPLRCYPNGSGIFFGAMNAAHATSDVLNDIRLLGVAG